MIIQSPDKQHNYCIKSKTTLIIPVILCLLLFRINVAAQYNFPRYQGQFEGFSTFFYDSTYTKLFQKNKVRAVTEIIAATNYTVTNGTAYFDKKGQVELYQTNSGTTKNHFKNGRVLKTDHLKQGDTATVEGWTEYHYDSTGILLKTENCSFNEGKLQRGTDSETIIKYRSSGKMRYQTTKYGYKDIYAVTSVLDSAAGDYHYTITYEFRPDEVDEKGRKIGEKELERSYEKDHCLYQETFKYKVYGRLEVPEDVKGYYYQNDDKGRLLEFGEIDYEKAMDEFYSEHPEEFTYGALSPRFIEALLAGKLSKGRNPNIIQKFDKNGKMTEQQHYGTNFKFKYNAQGQLTEQSAAFGEQPPRVETYIYDKLGLLVEVKSYTAPNEYGQGGEQIIRYSYRFY